MKIEIKCCFNAGILFECEAENLKCALQMAVQKNIYLRGANLRGANLRGANLQGANLGGADLRGADLDRANLRDAYLGGANLRVADLRGTNMQGANLRGAYLGGANLDRANLDRANLRDANMQGANLGDANMQEIKDDYFTILRIAKNEVKDLYKALIEGRINGSTYTGECACLVGTIANIRKKSPHALSIDLSPNDTRSAEKWFLAIRQGDMPSNNPVAAIVKDWTEEFMRENGINIPKIKTTWEE